MMKQILLVSVFASVFSTVAIAANKDQTAMDPKMQEMMKKYQEAATPGEQHKMLADFAGTWKYNSKMWPAPEAKPQESKGKSTFKMILNGRWLEQTFTGEAMGQKFEGRGLLGYDKVKGKFQSIWTDTMSTSAMQGEGTFDPTTKTIKESGTMSSPVAADKTEEYRTEWQMVDKKKMVFSMFGKGPADGPEYKMMEITYTK